MPVNDTLDAFVSHGHFELAPTGAGPLDGLTFALKDLFHVASVPTAAGSPAWLKSHPLPSENAPVVDMLLGAGARLVGKTHTDEMAWSLNGENHHYGTPINPAAPARIPGGSVRLPASYCGLIGLRPTHGRIPIDGAVPLAPSYDTVGWFARDADTFAKVGAVLLGGLQATPAPRLFLARDLFEAAGPEVTAALAPALARITALYGAAEEVDVAHGGLPHWRNAFRILQSADAWAAHADWVRAAQPDFGPGVKERFAAAATLDPAEVAEARALRAQVRARIDELLGEDGILLLPTAPGIAPLRGTPLADLEAFRARAIELLCLSGHAGTPQISLPLTTLDGCPLGLSAMAPRGKDEMLLALARALG